MRESTMQAIKDAGLWEAHQQIQQIIRTRTPTRQQARAADNADRIVALYEAGYSGVDVAHKVGVHAGLVWKTLQSRGIAIRTEHRNPARQDERNATICRRVAAGERKAQVGRDYGITGYRVTQIVRAAEVAKVDNTTV